MATFKKVFSNKPLLILGFAESISGIGNWITMMAVFSLLVFHQEGSVAESSGIFLTGLLPTLLISPIAGWLLDHFNRKTLMIGCQVLAGVVISGLIFTDSLVLIYTLLALESVFLTVMSPARQAVVPDLVEQADLTRTNAFLHQLASFIKIIAPVLAGFVLTLITPQTAIILDVFSFLLAALILTRLPSLPPHVQEHNANPTQEIKSYHTYANLWSNIKGVPKLSLLLLLLFFSIFIIIGFDVLAPVLIRDILKAGEDLFGLMIGLIGAGTLIASTFLFIRQKATDPWREFILGLFLLSIIPLFLAFSTLTSNIAFAKLLTMIGCLIGGVGNGFLIVQSGTLLQTLSPRPLLGRISGIFQSITVSGQLAGLLLTPILVPILLPIGTYFFIVAFLLASLSLCGLLLNKKHPEEPGATSLPLDG